MPAPESKRYGGHIVILKSFFYNISIIVRWISNQYGSFNKNMFIFQTNAIWVHTTYQKKLDLRVAHKSKTSPLPVLEDLNIKTVFPGMRIPMIEIRWS